MSVHAVRSPLLLLWRMIVGLMLLLVLLQLWLLRLRLTHGSTGRRDSPVLLPGGVGPLQRRRGVQAHAGCCRRALRRHPRLVRPRPSCAWRAGGHHLRGASLADPHSLLIPVVRSRPGAVVPPHPPPGGGHAPMRGPSGGLAPVQVVVPLVRRIRHLEHPSEHRLLVQRLAGLLRLVPVESNEREPAGAPRLPLVHQLTVVHWRVGLQQLHQVFMPEGIRQTAEVQLRHVRGSPPCKTLRAPPGARRVPRPGPPAALSRTCGGWEAGLLFELLRTVKL